MTGAVCPLVSSRARQRAPCRPLGGTTPVGGGSGPRVRALTAHHAGQGVGLRPEDQPGDHSPGDGEVEGHRGIATVEPRVAGTTVAEHRQRSVGGPVEEVRDRAAPDDPLRRAGQHGGVVGCDHDVRGEQREQPVELATPGGGHEGVHDLPVGQRRVHRRRPQLGTRPRRELASRGGGGVEDLGDRGELDREAVVQHEGHPLLGRQAVEHERERSPHLAGEHHLVGGVESTDRVLGEGAGVVDEHRAAYAQTVEAQPAGHRGEPGGEVVDLCVGAVPAQPRLLDDVLGLGDERAAALTEDSGLFGELPEFDSMAVATVLTEMEDRLGILIDDDDVDGEIFETYGNLLRFAERKVQG